jgi:peroxiredoxin
MKKLLLALPLLLFWACSPKEMVKIEGKIDNAKGKTLYLDRLNVSSTQVLDSIELDDKGRFKFKVENTKPEFYLLRLSNGKLITLLAEANENILVYSKGKNMSKNYTVEGSKGSKLVKQLNDNLNASKAKIAKLQKELKTKKNDPEFAAISIKLRNDYVKTLEAQRKFSINFIMKNATSLASYMALYQKIDPNNYVLSENKDIHFMKVVASSMKALYPQHEYTRAILADLNKMQHRLQNLKISKIIKEKGTSFPDIKLPDTNGKERCIADLKGKFIVLSFWASNDAYSRKENKNLKKVYKKYKNKGLRIYQISVDNDAELWKKAVKEDELPWINVCNPKTRSSSAVHLYNIQRVPANYLIDQRGEIVGKNLFGRALDEKIEEYVK